MAAIEELPAGIDLDSLTGAKPAPATPTTTAMISTISAAVEKSTDPVSSILYRDQLGSALQEKAKAYAAQSLPAILADPNKLGEFGLGAVEEINDVSQQMYHKFLGEQGVKIPELTGYTKELRSAVNGFSAKNERNTKRRQNIEAYKGIKGKLTDFVYGNIDWLRELIDDAKGLEKRMDGIVAAIIDKQAQLADNVELCNQLYDVNERAIFKLVFMTASLEYLHDLVVERRNAIVITPGDPDARAKNEQRENLRTLAEQTEVRLSEFKQRLFVAIATSPQLRNIRTLNYSLSQRLGMIVNLTIPVFKLTVVQWAMAIQAEQGATMTAAATDFNNSVLQEWAGTSAQMAGNIAATVQTPSTSPETILAIATSLEQQVEAFDKAYADGVAKRRAVDTAIVKASQIILEAPEKRQTTIRELGQAMQDTVQPDRLELPDEIAQLAPAALAKAS